MSTFFQRRAFSLLLVAVVLCRVTESCAQILVGSSGYLANPFTNTPPASEWATRDTLGGDSTTYTTPASLDMGAQSFDESTIVTSLTTRTGNNTSRLAYHNTNQSYLVTQPAGVPAVILKATLRNVSGNTISSITVQYDFGVVNADPIETAPGQRAFFSLTGQMNTWQLIPKLSGLTNSAHVSAVLSFGAWSPDTDLFLLWLDDNSVINPDGIYTIDNFAVSDIVLPPSSGITAALDPTTGEVTVNWFGGTLVETTQLLSGGTVWTNVPGNPSSPYTFAPVPGTQRFFAVRQQ